MYLLYRKQKTTPPTILQPRPAGANNWNPPLKMEWMNPPIKEPAMPIPIVVKNPIGSLPGCKNLATVPTIKANISQIKIENIFLSLNEKVRTNRFVDGYKSMYDHNSILGNRQKCDANHAAVLVTKRSVNVASLSTIIQKLCEINKISPSGFLLKLKQWNRRQTEICFDATTKISRKES